MLEAFWHFRVAGPKSANRGINFDYYVFSIIFTPLLRRFVNIRKPVKNNAIVAGSGTGDQRNIKSLCPGKWYFAVWGRLRAFQETSVPHYLCTSPPLRPSAASPPIIPPIIPNHCSSPTVSNLFRAKTAMTIFGESRNTVVVPVVASLTLPSQ